MHAAMLKETDTPRDLYCAAATAGDQEALKFAAGLLHMQEDLDQAWFPRAESISLAQCIDANQPARALNKGDKVVLHDRINPRKSVHATWDGQQLVDESGQPIVRQEGPTVDNLD
jgi:hypothetical protein